MVAMQVKIMKCRSYEDLERRINEFGEKHKIVSISYSNYPDPYTESALIMYEKEFGNY